ncbi:hypothetical protein FGG08_003760 [Glutinoglossum americanum]|uniref:Uncharacterized protein n=1 Tax=Glutinoglossum americanum TaxID=1670608 RepID=A0A9P8I217_9PEZI|nr:hypothetical protein FGG08_003760 [Glutinoglossum americanum]
MKKKRRIYRRHKGESHSAEHYLAKINGPLLKAKSTVSLNTNKQMQMYAQVWENVVHEKQPDSLSSLQLDLLQYVDGSAPLTPATLRSKLTLELAAKKVRKAIDLLAEDCSLRRFYWQMYIFAFDVAITQCRLTKQSSKLTDAIKFLDLARKFELLFCGKESDIVKENGGLCFRLKQS